MNRYLSLEEWAKKSLAEGLEKDVLALLRALPLTKREKYREIYREWKREMKKKALASRVTTA